jgi:DeoR/GlpR family transcriptional regulator of sugar metabolism
MAKSEKVSDKTEKKHKLEEAELDSLIKGEHEEETFMPRGVYIQTKLIAQNNSKRCIAEYIAENYVKDFDAVLLDAGSTAEMVAEEIFAKKRFLSVLTNNMGAYAAYTRSRGIIQVEAGTNESIDEQGALGSLNGNELLITGGRYVDTYESLLGEGAITSIIPFTPNITIIGISGLRCQEGVFCHGAEESAVKNLLWTKQTDIRLVAADWTKIGKRDAHAFGKIEQLGVNAKQAVLVTCNPPKDPQKISEKELEAFEEQIKQIKRNIDVIRLDMPKND